MHLFVLKANPTPFLVLCCGMFGTTFYLYPLPPSTPFLSLPHSLPPHQACDSRDSVCMSLYANIFRWILDRINDRLLGKETFKFVGVLDIFGFENFEVNRFEQFNINFANEKLQEYFNKHIFSLEQHEYTK